MHPTAEPPQRPATLATDRRHPWSVRVLDPATAAQVSDERAAAAHRIRRPAGDLPQDRRQRGHRGGSSTVAAKDLGWAITVRGRGQPDPRGSTTASSRSASRVADGRAVRPPDGFLLLQQARAARSETDALRTVGLDHVLHATDIGSDPLHDSDPLHNSDPLHDSDPLHNSDPMQRLRPGRCPTSTPVGRPTAGRLRRVRRRSGPPTPSSPADGRWSASSTPAAGPSTRGSTRPSRPTSSSAGRPIGYTLEATAPELHGDQVGPLDGVIDQLSGHGTFIAGLVHQICPDADILSWRVVPSEGPIVESDLVTALSQIAELARRYRAARSGRSRPRRPQPVDGLLPRVAGGPGVRPGHDGDPRRCCPTTAWSSSRRPATTPPTGRATPQRSARTSMADPDRLGRGAEPEPHRRACSATSATG